ncbi:MAG: hypothetical protein AAFV53_35580 [Myxococcota bacterium]
MSEVTGSPARWARDMAVIGGSASVSMPLMGALLVGLPIGYVAAAGIAGAVTGGGVGALMPGLLERLRGRIPLAALLVGLGPIIGALWGAAVGVLAAPAVGAHMLPLSVLTAGIGGALQFGLWWFPYTFQTVRKAPVLPVVLMAAVSAPILGVLTVLSVLGLMF